MRRVAEELVRVGRLHVRPLDRLAEEQAEPRPRRAERGSRREREIELEAAREQEDAVDRGAAREVEELHGVELVDEAARPVGEHVGHVDAVRDRERQVEVRPAVARALGKRADDRARDDAVIRVRQRKHAVAHPLAILDAEHGASLPRTLPVFDTGTAPPGTRLVRRARRFALHSAAFPQCGHVPVFDTRACPRGLSQEPDRERGGGEEQQRQRHLEERCRERVARAQVWHTERIVAA